MFTGLIEEVGTVAAAQTSGDGVQFTIHATKVLEDAKVDDSIAVNGCCLTVTSITPDGFRAMAVAETLRKTSLSTLRAEQRVNLERAVRLSDRLGGHMVQGHVDAVGQVARISTNSQGCEIWFSYPSQYSKWLIPAGSICVNGISLTVAELTASEFKVAVIPHTLTATTMGTLAVADVVNLEFDMIAKYIERLLPRAQA